AFSSGAGRTSDGNGSHASTLKSPSYTKSVSWQHYLMMVSAGAGTFNGESAVSVGTSFNAGTHTVLKAGISADTQSDFGAGVGVGYSF
ncbi:YadA C-terminal domain-containing protein, partial [Escherichia coli]|nr:YadA C-terminal domain-containing protein [Escherichia coli]